MNCKKCGRAIADGSQYCNYCGASQSAGSSGSRRGALVWGIILLVLGLLSLTGGFANGSIPRMLQEGMALPNFVSMAITFGCIIAGLCLTFGLDGSWWIILAVAGFIALVYMGRTAEKNAQAAAATEHQDTVWQFSVTAEPAAPAIEETVLDYIPAQISPTLRSMPDGAQCVVLETLEEVRGCTFVSLVLTAEGYYGATVQGNWDVEFRVNGVWKKITTVYYPGSGEAVCGIYFDAPTNFDAVCAYPVLSGNYSYEVSYGLTNAICK